MAGFFDLLGWGDSGWGDDLFRGLLVTVQISIGAYLAGLAIGGLVAWLKLSGPRWAVTLANGYSTVCRAVPEILLIIILFYAGQSALNSAVAALGFEDVGISGFAAAIVVLGLVQGAYASEIIRGAILAIPKGQIEAARAYGFEGAALFRRITLPAIVPFALPGLANLWMIIMKDSTLISVVGYNELLFTAKQAAGSSKYYFSFYLLVGAIYYALTILSNILIARIDARVRRWMPRGAS
ncbi:MAG: ABC transporter permease [Labrys sp. (in: a-proteobacteria)]